MGIYLLPFLINNQRVTWVIILLSKSGNFSMAKKAQVEKAIIIILLSNKHPYMFVTRKKPNVNKISQFIMNILIKGLLSSVLMTLLCRSL
jgi:hypothetical protein